MNEIKEILKLDIPTILIGTLVIVGGLKAVIELFKWVVSQFGIEFKHVRKQNEEHDMLVKTIGRMDELEKRQQIERNDAKKHDEELKNDISKLTNAVQCLSDKFDAMVAKSDATERASLKDRIAQLYRKYTVEKQWTKMEKESFIGLIKDYEAHGGKNSFVHSVCEPESFTWNVTDDDGDD